MAHGDQELGTFRGFGGWCWQSWCHLPLREWLAEYPGVLLSRKESLKYRRDSRRTSEPFMAVLMLLCVNSSCARASPIHGTQGSPAPASSSDEPHQLDRRDISSTTWVPVVAVVGFTVLLVVWTCWRQRKLIASFFHPQSRASTRLANPDDAARVPLTADQLVGSINNAGSGNEAGRTRRNRRQRRTPSQRSTYSLPAYAKEPGEQELVVAQGPPEEDAPVSQPDATVVDGDEEDPEASTDSDPQFPITPPQEASAELAPLIESGRACGPPVNLSRPSTDYSRQRPESRDTIGSTSLASISQDSSHVNYHPLLGPRGEAPGYFEVVGQADSAVDLTSIDRIPSSIPASPVVPDGVSPPASPQLPSPRRSGFHTLLNRTSISRTANNHARLGSSGSGNSSNIHAPDSPSRAHARGASTTSLISVLGLNRQKSFTSHNSSRSHLVSPSLISLNSISAPLTHTAIRTEFAAFPKQGLTPEQMRLISSREGLAKFGVPYGADAKAFASMSATDLASGERPPGFEAVAGENGSGGDASTSAAAEPSASTSGEGERAQETVLVLEDNSQASSTTSPSQPGSSDDSPAEQGVIVALVNPEDNSLSASLSRRNEGEIEKGADDKEIEAVEEVMSKHKGKAKETLALEDKDPLEEDKNLESTANVMPLATTGTTSSAEKKPGPSEEAVATAEPGTTVTDSTDHEIINEAPMVTPESVQSTIQTDGTSPSPPPIQQTSSSIVDTGINPPSTSLDLPQPGLPYQVDALKRERLDSRVSLLSYESTASLASNGTFRTAAESMRSRKDQKWTSTAAEEDDDFGEGYDTADDGNVTEGEGSSRPSTPTPREKMVTSYQAEVNTEATQLTPMTVKQDRHMSIATITHS